MKITLTPETPEDERRLRERAKRGAGSLFTGDSGFGLSRGLTRAAEEWVEENPELPGPGSVLRITSTPEEGLQALRIVRRDGKLMDLNGEVTNSGGWEVGVPNRYATYELVWDSGVAW